MEHYSGFELERLVATLLAAQYSSDPDRRDEYLDNAIHQVLPGGQPGSLTATSDAPTQVQLASDGYAGEQAQALHRATEQLAEAGGWQWNAQTEEVVWTPGTYELFDLPSDTSLDFETVMSYFHPDDRAQLEQAIEQCIDTGDPYELELRIQRNNHTRWVRVRGEALESDGDRIGLTGAIVDVTMMKEREQRLQVLNRILRHNLRNDLNVILGRAELLSEELEALTIPAVLYEIDEVEPFLAELEGLARDADSLHEEIAIVLEGLEYLASFRAEDAKTSAEVILKKSYKLNQLGEKARELDRVIGEMSETISTPVAVRPMIERVQGRFKSKFPEATIDIDCSDELRVLGMEAPLERAISELVENALEHGEEGEMEVTVAASEGADGRLEIRVEDNGCGIPPMERETLRRETETAVFHGQGIGLWLVAWIVRRLHGTVSIHDREPQGSIVCLDLPRAHVDDMRSWENQP